MSSNSAIGKLLSRYRVKENILKTICNLSVKSYVQTHIADIEKKNNNASVVSKHFIETNNRDLNAFHLYVQHTVSETTKRQELEMALS